MEKEFNLAAIPEGLAKKLSAIMRDSGYLKQEGRNQAQNYNYLSEEQLVFKLRELMNKHGVVMIPTVRSYEIDRVERKAYKGDTPPPFIMATVTVDYKIIDGDTGDAATGSMIGTGIDGGDKHIYKAITGANKYFLMKLFQIPSGNDPEKEGDWDRDVDAPAPQEMAPAPAPKNTPVKKVPIKQDGRTKAFRDAVDTLITAAKETKDTKTVDALVFAALGKNGFESISEITESKARRTFVADLKTELEKIGE